MLHHAAEIECLFRTSGVMVSENATDAINAAALSDGQSATIKLGGITRANLNAAKANVDGTSASHGRSVLKFIQSFAGKVHDAVVDTSSRPWYFLNPARIS